MQGRLPQSGKTAAARSPLSNRLLPFDGLRGLAALGVAAFHVYPLSPFLFWAWTLVDLFFVLSGFLIGSILYRGFTERSLNVRNFWLRRVLRIWPVYYIAMCAALLVGWLGSHLSGVPLHIQGGLKALVYLQFVGGYFHPGADWNGMLDSFIPWFGHSWSVAAEEQFYVILPVLMWLFGARARSMFLLSAFALIVSQTLLMTGFVPGLLGTRMQGLGLGLLLVPLAAWLRDDGKAANPKLRNWALTIIAVAAACGLAIDVPIFSTIIHVLSNGQALTKEVGADFAIRSVLGMSLVYFAIASFTLAFPRAALTRLLASRPLVYLGSISYALYMFHVPVEGLFYTLRGKAPGHDTLWVQVAYWTTAIGLAHCSKIFVENFFNSMKDRYPVYRKVPGSAAAGLAKPEAPPAA